MEEQDGWWWRGGARETGVRWLSQRNSCTLRSHTRTFIAFSFDLSLPPPYPPRKNHRSQPPFQLGFRALRQPERVVVAIGDRVPTRHRNRSQALLIYEKSPVDRRRRPSVRIDHVFLRRRWKTLEPSVARCRTLPTLFYLALCLITVPSAGPQVCPSPHQRTRRRPGDDEAREEALVRGSMCGGWAVESYVWHGSRECTRLRSAAIWRPNPR